MILYYLGRTPITVVELQCGVCDSKDVLLDPKTLSNGHTGAFCKGCRASFEVSFSPRMIDPKHCSYDDVEAIIRDQPKTFYPALLSALIQASYEKKVWCPSGASTFVKKVEEKHGWDLK